MRRYSHLDIPTKDKYLTGVGILIPMGRFFDTILDVYYGYHAIHLHTGPTVVITVVLVQSFNKRWDDGNSSVLIAKSSRVFLSSWVNWRCWLVWADELDTFVIYNERRKVTSSAKRRRKPTDTSLHQVCEFHLGNPYELIFNYEH